MGLLILRNSDFPHPPTPITFGNLNGCDEAGAVGERQSQQRDPSPGSDSSSVSSSSSTSETPSPPPTPHSPGPHRALSRGGEAGEGGLVHSDPLPASPAWRPQPRALAANLPRVVRGPAATACWAASERPPPRNDSDLLQFAIQQSLLRGGQ